MPNGLDASHGVMLRLQGVNAAGEAVSGQWKAFAIDGSSKLKWELRWCLPSVGFHESGKMRLWRHIHDGWGRWQAMLEAIAFPPATHMGKSRKALQRVGGEGDPTPLEHAEQEHWVSTPGLLCLLVSWAIHRRKLVDRQASNVFFRLLLQRCLAPAKCQPLCGWAVPAAATWRCKQELVVRDCCSCIRDVLSQALPGRAGTAQEEVLDKLTLLMKFATCPAVSWWCHSLIDALAEGIEDATETWGDFEWHDTAGAFLKSAVKRRRTDAHVKAHVLQHQVLSGKAPTAASAGRCASDVDASQAVRWMQAEMAAYRAHLNMSLQDSVVVALACDAARVGHPAREMLVGAASDPDRQRHGILPPQVLCMGGACPESQSMGVRVYVCGAG